VRELADAEGLIPAQPVIFRNIVFGGWRGVEISCDYKSFAQRARLYGRRSDDMEMVLPGEVIIRDMQPHGATCPSALDCSLLRLGDAPKRPRRLRIAPVARCHDTWANMISPFR
jgi:hypothetical protein